ncbi:MAG: Holliday junction resolvase RuvX [Candidatus Marinimicrobia bacterium]|jgi:putative Holliday junction resolvase|nr:Holliday junction resolvase RuvX [Candidatus Neomarinimicrobiota bacterium]MDP6612147.1 Holliday junction resolvase RuvX [Candidatus Neomarinimicrobiota bacterium]|tara:strand:- start:15999 stop:16412 length:414 start_codon:yes stop_codon:yes gene_type:complete
MGRFLGIDHGQKRVGLALSDPLKIIAKPYKTITYTNVEDLCGQIQHIIDEQMVERIVLGLPKGMQGQNTKQTENVSQFGEHLKSVLNIPVVMEDERLSSISAKKALIQQDVKTGHNKGRIDETAAAIFLQQYLDRTS